MAQKQVFAEDQYGHKIDRCVSDAMIKFGVGLTIGGLVSLLFVKRRLWPVVGGGFFGLGAAYQNCQKSLNKS